MHTIQDKQPQNNKNRMNHKLKSGRNWLNDKHTWNPLEGKTKNMKVAEGEDFMVYRMDARGEEKSGHQ